MSFKGRCNVAICSGVVLLVYFVSEIAVFNSKKKKVFFAVVGRWKRCCSVVMY